MTPKCHVRFGGGLGEQEHRYLARSLPYRVIVIFGDEE